AIKIAEGTPAGVSGLAQTFAELQDVYADDEEHNETFLRPTPAAFASALSVVIQAYLSMGHHFPRASVAADGGGGIRLTWMNGERNVRLVFSARDPASPYLYHEAGSEYDVVRDVTPPNVEQWLRWLAGSV